MKQQDVEHLSTSEFLVVMPSAASEINAIGASKPQGAFRIRCDIQAQKTDIIFAWDDVFREEDFLLDIKGLDYAIVMDAMSIAYILDEYVLDYKQNKFSLVKNPGGPLRHQK
jgi:hypothetical protein